MVGGDGGPDWKPRFGLQADNGSLPFRVVLYGILRLVTRLPFEKPRIEDLEQRDTPARSELTLVSIENGTSKNGEFKAHRNDL